MKTLFENKEGNVSTDNAKIKIPTTHTALGVLSQNNINDGEEFRDDYWVYKNNERVRKWFVGHPLKRTWLPNLAPKRLEEIEQTYWRLNKKAKDKWDEVWKIADDARETSLRDKYDRWIIDVPSVVYGNKERFCFNVSEHGLGSGWSLISDPVSNGEIGEVLYKKHLYCENLWGRLDKVKKSLLKCIENKVKENIDVFKNDIRSIVPTAIPTCIAANGRQYWIRVECGESYVKIAEMFSFGEKVIHLACYNNDDYDSYGDETEELTEEELALFDGLDEEWMDNYD